VEQRYASVGQEGICPRKKLTKVVPLFMSKIPFFPEAAVATRNGNGLEDGTIFRKTLTFLFSTLKFLCYLLFKK